MSNIIIPDQHVFLKKEKEILDVCQNFFIKSKINFFNFYRGYKDGRFILIASNSSAIQGFYNSGHSLVGNHSGVLQNKRNYFFCSSSFDAGNNISNDSILFLKENFNIDNVFAIVDKKQNYIDIFGFSTHNSNIDKINYYFNNMASLERFILEFKEKYSGEINNLEKHALLLSDDLLIKSNKILSSEIKIDKNVEKLTLREIDCFFYALRGHTAKTTAKVLNISQKTVEFYLERLKFKFKCSSKTELITKAIAAGYLEKTSELIEKK